MGKKKMKYWFVSYRYKIGKELGIGRSLLTTDCGKFLRIHEAEKLLNKDFDSEKLVITSYKEISKKEFDFNHENNSAD